MIVHEPGLRQAGAFGDACGDIVGGYAEFAFARVGEFARMDVFLRSRSHGVRVLTTDGLILSVSETRG
mgnify:FL=1